MKTAYNHLTHSYETPDKTTVAAEICEGDSPSDAFCAAAIREQQRKSAAYALTVIDALYENSDPVSIDAAELLESLSKAQPQQEPVAIEYWLQDTMESGRWVKTDNMAKATAEKMLSGEYGDVYPRGRIVEPSPPASKPLTDEQIMEMYNEPRSDAEMLEFARAIEAAHGIGEQK